MLDTDPSQPDQQVQLTIDQMREIVHKETNSPQVAAAVRAAGAYRGSNRSKSQAVWRWIRRNVQFQDDNEVLADALGMPGAQDLLIEPSRLLTMPQPMGDCDDQTMLAAAMLTRAGVPVEFVVAACDPETPERFSHVYLQSKLESGDDYNLDCSHGYAPGWEVPRRFRRAVFGLSPQYIGSLGLAGLGDDYGGATGYDWDYSTSGYPEQWTSEVYDGGGVSSGILNNSGSSSSAWANLFGSLVKPGAILNPLHSGEYVQTAAGVQSRAVPGAAPYPSGTGGALPSISPTVMLAIAGIGIAAVAFSGKGK